MPEACNHMSANEKQVEKTTVRIPPELMEQVKYALVKRRTKFQKAVEEGLRLWLDPRPIAVREMPNSNTKNAEWHAKLELILEHGTDRDVIGIQQNLEWAATTIKAGRAARRAGGK